MTLDKLKCRMGWHIYRPSEAELDHVVDDTYRITIRCNRCGKQDCALIRVPVPPWIEKRKSGAVVLHE